MEAKITMIVTHIPCFSKTDSFGSQTNFNNILLPLLLCCQSSHVLLCHFSCCCEQNLFLICVLQFASRDGKIVTQVLGNGLREKTPRVTYAGVLS